MLLARGSHRSGREAVVDAELFYSVFLMPSVNSFRCFTQRRANPGSLPLCSPSAYCSRGIGRPPVLSQCPWQRAGRQLTAPVPLSLPWSEYFPWLAEATICAQQWRSVISTHCSHGKANYTRKNKKEEECHLVPVVFCSKNSLLCPAGVT